jgi:hypothetical protein
MKALNHSTTCVLDKIYVIMILFFDYVIEKNHQKKGFPKGGDYTIGIYSTSPLAQ